MLIIKKKNANESFMILVKDLIKKIYEKRKKINILINFFFSIKVVWEIFFNIKKNT